MLTLLETLAGFWLLTTAWGCWKKTLRDMLRDDLFDLRDEWRVFWTASGRDTDSSIYRNVRDYLNQYLRYTKSLRFVGLVYIVLKIDSRAVDRLCAEHERMFVTGDAAVAAEIRRIRHNAVRGVQAYMCGTTLVLLAPLLIVAGVSLVAHSLKGPARVFRAAAGRLVDAMPCTKAQNIDMAVCVAA